MKRHEIVTLARAQIAHANSYLERSIFANDFSDDDIDYAVSACDTITSLVTLLVSDDALNAADDDEIDTAETFREIANHACDGVCNELHDLIPDPE